MYLRRTAISGFLGALLISGACTAAQDAKSKQGGNEKASKSEAQESRFRAGENQEMVEIKIRMPDGRVIVRKERKNASRIHPSHPIVTGERPPVVVQQGGGGSTKGEVSTTNQGVSGGSNAGAGSVSVAGSGGGGGGATRAPHGGGGGGGGGDRGDSDTSGGNPPPGGDAGDDSPTPVQPDSDLSVHFFAWGDTGGPFDHVSFMYIADPRIAPAARLARRIADQVRHDRPEKVVLRFWKEFSPATTYPFDLSNPQELIRLDGYRDGLEEYWSVFAMTLRDEGVTPDYLVFDMERGISYWHIPEEDRVRFFSQLIAPREPLSMLPSSMRTVAVDDFVDTRSDAGDEARGDYAQYAMDFRARLIRDVFVDTFTRIYGHEIHASNFNDVIPSAPVYEYTNSTVRPASIGGISAPIIYVEDRTGGSSRYNRAHKHARWNRLIDAINAVRSTAQPGWTTPWLAPPGYGRYGADSWARVSDLDEEYELWEVLMSHMLAMGVDTFILWNPETRFNPNAAVTDAWMDDWLGNHPTVSTPQLRSLEQIPLDADEIETNGVVTTYDEFLAIMGLAGD